jgi:gliding motility-associated lipoprotein GldH
MYRNLIIVCCSVLLLSFLYSCDKAIMFEESKHISNTEWKAVDTVFFSFDVNDSLQSYDFGFNVRNTTSYSYQNLFLFITAWYPDGSWSRDTAECILAATDGRWLGKGNGKIRDSQFLFRKDVHFRRSGHYTIGINQAMRTDKLNGISDIGIRITKSGN